MRNWSNWVNLGSVPRDRTQERTIDPAALGVSWWVLTANMAPGTSGLARRLVYDRDTTLWEIDTSVTARTIYDRPSGPGGPSGLIVGCVYLPTSRAWEIIHTKLMHWARVTPSAIDDGESGLVTVYRRSAGAWVATSWTLTAYDVQLVTGGSIAADSRVSIEWEPYNPLVTAAPFGQWLIRTASCGAVTW